MITGFESLIKKFKNGSVQIELALFNNYELKSTLLSYGPGIEVIKPKTLREELRDLYSKGEKNYNSK